MSRGIFITGTDTGVGKTHFSCLLIKALRALGVDAVGMKPFCCGDRSDAESLHQASGSAANIAHVNPVWLRVPAAPYTASLVENRPLDIATAGDAFLELTKNHSFVVVEGIGGWRVPLTDTICMSDFATGLNLPVLVVSANRLGTLNHTQLTVDSIRAKGALCGGVILNEPAATALDAASVTNQGVLEQILDVPVLACLENGGHSLPAPLMSTLLKLGLIPSGT